MSLWLCYSVVVLCLLEVFLHPFCGHFASLCGNFSLPAGPLGLYLVDWFSNPSLVED